LRVSVKVYACKRMRMQKIIRVLVPRLVGAVEAMVQELGSMVGERTSLQQNADANFSNPGFVRQEKKEQPMR
jgi:hypothetical protein